MAGGRRLTVVLLLCLQVTCWALCPRECACKLDNSGRREVLCGRGGMADPIPIPSIDPQVEVLIIAAPVDSPNALTIGPIFQQFTHLEELHIVRSNIPAIGRHSFWGVPTLQVLNLTQNNISHVLDHNFRGLVNLLELHLDDNRIESMPSGTFRHLTELRVLSLARNRISELVPRLFLMLGKLHELDLSGNHLGELNPEVFKDVQELRVFKCRGCGLSNLNTLIYRLLPELLYLDLGDNEFKYVASDEFRFLKKLQVLMLDGNQLPVILERTFGKALDGSGHQDLQKLSLARNRLAKVTALAFANLTTLRELDISYNKLDRLETVTFMPLAESLRTLKLSGNLIPLSEVKYVLQVIVRLRDLALADMGLNELPLGFLVYHEHLRSLNLSGNHFMHLPAQMLSPVPKLQELDLSRNRFRGLDERLLLRMEAIPVIHLHDNPWVCDICHLAHVLNFVNKSTVGAALRGLVCYAPYSLKGRLIGSLSRGSMPLCTSNDGGLGYMGGDGGLGGGIMSTNFLAEHSRFGLLAAGAGILLLLLTGAALLAGIAYSRHHHAARYYTREETRGPDHEAIFENPAAILAAGENGDIKYKIVPLDLTATTLPPKTPPSHHPPVLVKKKTVTISTIDGNIAKDPELHSLTNGT